LPQQGSSFKSWSKRKLVGVITISLFAIAILSASLLLYQAFLRTQSPITISREDAISIMVAEATDRGFYLTPIHEERVTSTELLHVRNNGFAFVVDQGTLEDTLQINVGMPEKYENYYVWKVKMHNADNPNDEWESWIDATNGAVLLSAIDGGVIMQKE
jgi:hypothetical protein